MSVHIDSGDFPTSKGKKDGDLDRVIGQWQLKISSGFNEGAEWLLKAIQEVDDQELWRTYWGGGFGFNESREAFIARKLLVDFKVVETTVPAILEKLQQSATTGTCIECGQSFVTNRNGRKHEYCSSKCRVAGHRKKPVTIETKPTPAEWLDRITESLESDTRASAICELISVLSEREFKFIKRWINQSKG